MPLPELSAKQKRDLQVVARNQIWLAAGIKLRSNTFDVRSSPPGARLGYELRNPEIYVKYNERNQLTLLEDKRVTHGKLASYGVKPKSGLTVRSAESLVLRLIRTLGVTQSLKVTKVEDKPNGWTKEKNSAGYFGFTLQNSDKTLLVLTSVDRNFGKLNTIGFYWKAQKR
jgi:hypothetical protein